MRVKVIGASGRMGQIHCRTYKELGLEIVDDGEDIVSIASPDQTHGDYVAKALVAGRHVFCEKPLCTEMGQLEYIIFESVKHPYLHIGQNFPLRYVYGDASDDLGKIYRAEFFYEWARFEKLGVGWRGADYSLVMGGLIHMADLAVFLLGNPGKKRVAASSIRCGDFFGPFCITASVEIGGTVTGLVFDGGPGPQHHCHEVRLYGFGGQYVKVNKKETPKAAAIRDFVKNLDKPPENDFRATRLCLEIDECIASTSRVH